MKKYKLKRHYNRFTCVFFLKWKCFIVHSYAQLFIFYFCCNNNSRWCITQWDKTVLSLHVKVKVQLSIIRNVTNSELFKNSLISTQLWAYNAVHNTLSVTRHKKFTVVIAADTRFMSIGPPSSWRMNAGFPGGPGIPGSPLAPMPAGPENPRGPRGPVRPWTAWHSQFHTRALA